MPITADGLITNAPGKGITTPSAPIAGAQVAGFGASVVFNQKKVTAAVGPGGLAIADAQANGTGVYVPATPDQCNVGKLSAGENFFYSDQFGGCDFTVLQDPTGNWVGSHVFSSDACRNDIAAIPANWQTIYTWRSLPYAKKYGMSGSIAMCCFVSATHLKFVMLRVSGSLTPTVNEVVLSASIQI